MLNLCLHFPLELWVLPYVFWTGPFYLSDDHDSELIIVSGSSDCREQSVPPQAPEGAGPWMAQRIIPLISNE